MSEFTKGKWYVIQGAGIDELDVISEDKRNICCLFGYSVSRWNEQKANARLIAAAPEMYELLKVWVQVQAQPTLRNAQDKARELIERIDGDNPKGGENE